MRNLAKGYQVVVLISLSSGALPEVFRRPLDRELQTLKDSGSRVALITPDAGSVEAFGPNLMDYRRRPAAAAAGIQQGKAGVEEASGSFGANNAAIDLRNRHQAGTLRARCTVSYVAIPRLSPRLSQSIVGFVGFRIRVRAQSAANPSVRGRFDQDKQQQYGRNGRLTMTVGRINFSSVTLKECVIAAYDLRSYQVASPASLTALLTSNRYDIVATAGGPASNAELKTMLKTLLADRFKLKIHRETREMAAYRLVVTKASPKVTRAAADQPGGYALWMVAR